MKQILICFALAMLLPSVVAFNCNSLSGGDLYVCNSIQSTSLSSAEKDLFISDIFNKNRTLPNFDFIYSWNSNLNIQSPSDNQYHYSGTIQNAWVDVVALMPAIIENNTLYGSDKGKLQTVYNYNYGSLPSGTESGDCATYYSWDSKNAYLNVYLNNNLIGSDKITAYQVYNNPDNLNFRADLNIFAKYKVEHYKNERYCSRRDSRGRCTRYSYRCRYYSTQYRTDSLTISDSLNAKLYKNQLDSSFKVTDKYFNVTKGVLTASNFTNLILSFNNSQYQNNRYIYSLSYTLPYYVLTLKAEPVDNTNFNNIHVGKDKNNFTFTIQDTSNCKIQLFDHFNTITKPCDLSYNQINFSIKTDKTNYYENDTIKVYITPDNILVNLTYGNQSKAAKNYSEFKPLLYENKINAKLNDKNVNVLVNVTKKEDIDLLYNFGVLSFLGYFFFKAAKVYFLTFPI